MHGFAGHHGKAAGAKRRFCHAVHPGEHIAPHYHQLFFRGVIVRGNHAPRRSFEKESGRACVWIAVLARNFEARGLAVENQIGARERCDYAVRRNPSLSSRRRARSHEQDQQRRKAEMHFHRSSRNGIYFVHSVPQRKSNDENSVKLRRHTIQVWAPGVSMSTCLIFFDANQPRNLRLMSIKRSSVPQATHSKCSCAVLLESRPGNSFSKSSVIPPELNAPTQPNLSRVSRLVSRDSDPPMERPAMARELRSLTTR